MWEERKASAPMVYNAILASMPFGRLGKPEKIAATVLSWPRRRRPGSPARRMAGSCRRLGKRSKLIFGLGHSFWQMAPDRPISKQDKKGTEA